MTLPISVLGVLKSLAYLPWWLWVFLLAYALSPLVQRFLEDYFDSLRFARAGLKNVENMSGEDFEKYLGFLFKGLGYRVERTPYQGDFGADLVVTDPTGRRFAVQAKRWRGHKVGVKALHEVHGGKAYYKCDGAIVVTTSRYTAAARRMARETGTQLWGIHVMIAAMDKVKAAQGSPR